jgi:hypothetical protein
MAAVTNLAPDRPDQPDQPDQPDGWSFPDELAVVVDDLGYDGDTASRSSRFDNLKISVFLVDSERISRRVS